MSFRLAPVLFGNLQFDLVGPFLSGLLGRFFLSYLLFEYTVYSKLTIVCWKTFT